MNSSVNTKTAEDILREWKKGAKCKMLLNMTTKEVTEFALMNELDVREARSANWILIGWRLYRTRLDFDGKERVPDELYYVVRKI